MTDTDLTRSARAPLGSPDPTSARRSSVRAAVATALVGMFMAVMDGFIVIVAGPAVQADLGTSAGQLQWVLAAYQLIYAVSMITAGRVADMIGRRRMFLGGVAVFTLSSIACALAPSSGALIAARSVQGVGAAMIVPQVFAMITLLVPKQAHPRLFGVVSIVIALASMGGQLLGGLLVGLDVLGLGWRSVFWINLPIGLVIVALAVRFMPESRGPTGRRLDLSGVALLSIALFTLMLPLLQGREAGWSWWTWVSFAASVMAFAVFVFVERRVERAGRTPLMQLTLFTERAFSCGLLLVMLLYALLTSYYLALSVTLQEGLGLSALQAGLVYAPAPVTFFCFGVLAGRLIPRYGRRVLEVGAVVLAVGYLTTVIAVRVSGGVSPLVLIPTLMLQAVGGGLVITPSLNVVLSRIRPEAIGMASGALSTAQQVGAALGVAVVGAVFFSHYRPAAVGPSAAARDGFVSASLAVFVIAVLTVVLVHLLPRARAKQ